MKRTSNNTPPNVKSYNNAVERADMFKHRGKKRYNLWDDEI